MKCEFGAVDINLALRRCLMEGINAFLRTSIGLFGAVDIDVDGLLRRRRQNGNFLRRDFHEAAGNSDELLVTVGTEPHAHSMRFQPRDERLMMRQDTEFAARRTDDEHRDICHIDHLIGGDNL